MGLFFNRDEDSDDCIATKLGKMINIFLSNSYSYDRFYISFIIFMIITSIGVIISFHNFIYCW